MGATEEECVEFVIPLSHKSSVIVTVMCFLWAELVLEGGSVFIWLRVTLERLLTPLALPNAGSLVWVLACNVFHNK